MNCQEYREWFRKREILSSEGIVSEAYLHAKTCKECSVMNKIDTDIENKFRKELYMREVPDGLLNRIELNIKSIYNVKKRTSVPRLKHGGTSLWKTAAPAFAVAAMVLLFISYNFAYFRSVEEVGRLSVESHMENLPMMFKAEEVKDISLWFRERLSFPVSIPEIGESGLKLVGGRKCKLGRNEVAYLFYKKGDKRISLYVIDTKKIKYEMEDNKKYHLPFKECEVDIWKSGDMVYSLVR
ncbi:MAG: hypothetical protein HY096_14590 [Nitrospinae bacterium]|nr:hypothetical protein [Nitrospinota bacterium]